MSTAGLVHGYGGALLSEGFLQPPPVTRTSDALKGLRLAVKDVFDVQGLRTGAGNPAWWAQQATAGATARSVELLLAAGANWLGKTVTDELAYSLMGINAHYGTPCNTAAPERIPGGSSSGSAAAVAGGYADIGLGSDCGGSCRLPASYCGIWGIRPTAGLITKQGAFTLAPSFDTVGWFTRDSSLLARVHGVLTRSCAPQPCEATIHLSEDAANVCDPPVRETYLRMAHRLQAHHGLQSLPAGTLPLQTWADAHRKLQGAEIWREHGDWVQRNRSHLAGDVRSRFDAAARIDQRDLDAGRPIRDAARGCLAALLAGRDHVLLIPTAPGIAPMLNARADELANARTQAQSLLCLAGLAGLPQVSFPWIEIAGAPVGLSVIGRAGADALVIGAAMSISETLSGRRACAS